MTRVSTHLALTTFFLALLSGLGFSFLNLVNPQEAHLWQFASLYLIIFFWVFSATTILGYFWRVLFWRSGARYEFVRSGRRQGAWFGLLAVLALLLQVAGVFNLYTALPLLVIFMLIELYVQ